MAQPPDTRLSIRLNKSDKKVDLEINSTTVSDSALYYCAMRPTVTGKTVTLYKNLYTEEGAVSMLIF